MGKKKGKQGKSPRSQERPPRQSQQCNTPGFVRVGNVLVRSTSSAVACAGKHESEGTSGSDELADELLDYEANIDEHDMSSTDLETLKTQLAESQSDKEKLVDDSDDSDEELDAILKAAMISSSEDEGCMVGSADSSDEKGEAQAVQGCNLSSQRAEPGPPSKQQLHSHSGRQGQGQGTAVLVDAYGQEIALLEQLSLQERFPIQATDPPVSAELKALHRPKNKSAVRGAQNGKLNPGEQARLKREARVAKRAARAAARGFDVEEAYDQLQSMVDGAGDMLTFGPTDTYSAKLISKLAKLLGLSASMQGGNHKRPIVVVTRRLKGREREMHGADAEQARESFLLELKRQRQGAMLGAGVGVAGMAIQAGGRKQYNPAPPRPPPTRDYRSQPSAPQPPEPSWAAPLQQPVRFVSAGVMDLNDKTFPAAAAAPLPAQKQTQQPIPQPKVVDGAWGRSWWPAQPLQHRMWCRHGPPQGSLPPPIQPQSNPAAGSELLSFPIDLDSGDEELIETGERIVFTPSKTAPQPTSAYEGPAAALLARPHIPSRSARRRANAAASAALQGQSAGTSTAAPVSKRFSCTQPHDGPLPPLFGRDSDTLPTGLEYLDEDGEKSQGPDFPQQGPDSGGRVRPKWADSRPSKLYSRFSSGALLEPQQPQQQGPTIVHPKAARSAQTSTAHTAQATAGPPDNNPNYYPVSVPPPVQFPDLPGVRPPLGVVINALKHQNSGLRGLGTAGHGNYYDPHIQPAEPDYTNGASELSTSLAGLGLGFGAPTPQPPAGASEASDSPPGQFMGLGFGASILQPPAGASELSTSPPGQFMGLGFGGPSTLRHGSTSELSSSPAAPYIGLVPGPREGTPTELSSSPAGLYRGLGGWAASTLRQGSAADLSSSPSGAHLGLGFGGAPVLPDSGTEGLGSSPHFGLGYSLGYTAGLGLADGPSDDAFNEAGPISQVGPASAWQEEDSDPAAPQFEEDAGAEEQDGGTGPISGAFDMLSFVRSASAGGPPARPQVAVWSMTSPLDDGSMGTLGRTKKMAKREQKKAEKEARRQEREEGHVQATRQGKVQAMNFGAFENHTTGIGSKLMQKMGWQVGVGLGREGQGRAEPLGAVMRPKQLGLGAERRKKDGGPGG